VATPPADWLRINGPNTIVFLERTPADDEALVDLVAQLRAG
jgi:hypothetical protein